MGHIGRFTLPISACVMLAALAGCPASRTATPVPTAPADAPESQRAAKELRPGIWRYTTRGVVTRLPAATGLARDLSIHHEALTAFHTRDGRNAGMNAMEMEFPSIAPGVSLEGLKLHDLVVFDFDVDWDSRDVWTVTRLVKLPEGTPLKFDSPSPTAPPPTPSSAPTGG
jgi:hypothetical protein